MDRNRVARELLGVAKEIVGADDIKIEIGDMVETWAYRKRYVVMVGSDRLWESQDEKNIERKTGWPLLFENVKAIKKKGTNKWIRVEWDKNARSFTEIGKTAIVAHELAAFRSVPGDPYWIDVKYRGQCRKCHKPIDRGERAFYYPKGKSLYCGKCGQEAEADFRSHSEMDRF